MKGAFTGFLAGLLFGAGLLTAQMTDPARVQAFLDITGSWNPALALVMAGGIAIAFPAFAYVKRHPQTLRGEPVYLPQTQPINLKLIAGAAIFGIGWGLAGICPGPALVLAGRAAPGALLFVVMMALGSFLADRFTAQKA